MPYTYTTLAERPELEAAMPRLHSESWPEFVLNDPVAIRYWGSLCSTFADFQYVLCDEQGEALAAGHGIPLAWAREMKAITARHRLKDLVIPLRPSLKSQYPLMSMEEYVQWKRADGEPFDPWLRIHWRLGATVLCLAPLSMVITETVSKWEEWTGMRFPESGQYTVPGALSPIVIDRTRDLGRYEEPNIWIQYANVSDERFPHSSFSVIVR